MHNFWMDRVQLALFIMKIYWLSSTKREKYPHTFYCDGMCRVNRKKSPKYFMIKEFRTLSITDKICIGGYWMFAPVSPSLAITLFDHVFSKFKNVRHWHNQTPTNALLDQPQCFSHHLRIDKLFYFKWTNRIN